MASLRLERETLLVEMQRDALDDELSDVDIAKRESEMDKEILKLIRTACKNDDIPAAIELAKLFHHIPFFDAAKKVAEFYIWGALTRENGTAQSRSERRVRTG